MKNVLRGLFVLLAMVMPLPHAVFAHSVAQLQTTKYFHPDTVNMLITRAQSGNPGFQVGDTVYYIIEFTPVANGSNIGVQGYVTDYVPDGVEVVQASIVTKDGAGNFVDVSPGLPGLSYDGWGARGQATFNAPFNVATYDASGKCTAGAFTNNCNARMCELQADTGIFYSTDPRTAQYPAMPTRIVQGVAGNGYNIKPTREAQLLPLLGGGVSTTHNLWDADQTNAFGTSAANLALIAAPKSSQPVLVATRPGDVPFNAGSPVAGPQTGYQLDSTATVGPWQRIYYPGSRIGDATRGPAIAAGAVAGAVCGSTTSTGWRLSSSNPLPSGVNAVRWALGKLQVGEIKYVKVGLRLTAPIPAAGLVNSSEVFGADTANGDPSTAITTGDNAWLYHIPSVADNNSNLLVLKKVVGYYAPATPTVLTPSDGSSIPMNAKVRYEVTYLNSGNLSQSNVVLSDTLPCQTAANPVSGITIISGPMTSTVAPVVAAGTVAANCTAAGRMTFSFPVMANLGPGQGGTIRYDVQLSGMAAGTLYNVPNTAKLTSTAIPAGVVSNANATVTAAASPILSISKTSSTPNVNAGGVATYTVTVTNVGTAATTGAVNVYDFLPYTGTVNDPLTRFSYAAALSTTGATAVAPVLSVPPALAPYAPTAPATTNQQQLLWTFPAPNLAPGASIVITYTANVGASVPSSALPYYSSAAVTYTGGVTRADTTSTAPVSVASTLALSSSIVGYYNGATLVPYSNFIPANAKVRYQLNYSNTGATDIVAANISNLLPCQTAANAVSNIVVSGPIAVPAPNPPVTAAGNCATGVRSAFAFTAGTIPAGSSGTVAFDVLTNAANGNTVVNTATVSAAGVSSATSEVQTTVQSAPALTVSKTQSVSASKAGNTVTYTLTVTNTGTANATNMSIYDWLPSGGAALNPATRFSYGATTITGLTAVAPTLNTPPTQIPFNTNANAANMQELVWNFGAQTLAPGASFTISYTAAIGASVPLGSYGNYAKAYYGTTALAGTVAVTTAGAVTGTGTSFLTTLAPGSVVTIAGVDYTVATVTSATAMTLTKGPLAAIPAGTVISKKTSANTSNTVSMQVAAGVADLAMTMTNDGGAAVMMGAPVAYTITLTNNGPDAADGVKILDAATAGLTKDMLGITCTATGGAVCPSALYLSTLAKTDLESGGMSIATLPAGGSITLTIDTTVTASSGTVTNAASTVLPAGLTEGNYATPSFASNTTPVSAPNLSTATKTWVDLNGGDVMPGDTIRYSITLTETGGFDATAVTVTDDIPAGLTNLNVLLFPAGATDNSTLAGGAYGAGKLGISNITVLANSSEIISFDVKVPAAAATGTSYANTATVTFTNGDGMGGTPTAAPVVVAASAIPQGGLKHMYLYDAAATPARKLSRVKPAAGAAVALPGVAATVLTTAGAATWTAPAGTTSVMVEVWGGGGGSGGISVSPAGTGGGGGGAYARLDNYTVAPGTAYAYTVGAGGIAGTTAGAAGGAGGDTFFVNAATLLAKGGAGGGANNGAGGLGGAAAASVGTVKFSGGNGAAGTATIGGGGGGSGGNAAAGNSAVGAVAGAAVAGGVAGAAGLTARGTGVAGPVGGGGAGGSLDTRNGRTRAGAVGGVGKLSITPLVGGNSVLWTQDPPLASAVTISSTISPTVPVSLLLSSATAGTYSVRVELYCTATPATVIGVTNAVPLTATATAAQFNIPLAGSMTCAAGSTWAFRVTNLGVAAINVTPVSGASNSFVQLPATTVINVDSVTAYGAAYPATTLPASFAPGNVVYARAVVSDPFGNFDITSATLSITDPNGAALAGATNVAMTAVDSLNGAGTAMAGTVAATLNSTAITGTGTAFTAAMVGKAISINGNCYVIAARASNTAITLASPFTGPTATGLAVKTSTLTACPATKTYEYAYTVPAGAAGGAYTLSVNAKEGVENLIADTGVGTFQIPGLHHIQLEHTGSNVTCTGAPVTLKACSDANCTTNSITATDVTLSPATGWKTAAGTAITFPLTFSGSTTVYLGITTPQTVTLAATAVTPAPSNATTLPSSGATTYGCTPSCDLVFEDAGFIISDTPTGAAINFNPEIAGFSDITYYLRAVKTSDATKRCETLLTGAQTVQFAYECNDPSTCFGADLLTVNGGTNTVIARNNNAPLLGYSYSNVSMNFDPANNHAAPFTWKYSDVGYVTLHMKTTAGGASIKGNSNSVLVSPYEFVVTACNAAAATPCVAAANDPAWLNGGGTASFVAGQPFQATISARACNQVGMACDTTTPGTMVPSFGSGTASASEQVDLTYTFAAPVGGSPGTLTGSGVTVPLFRSAFTNGSVTLNNLVWSEVGVISLQAQSNMFINSDLLAVGRQVMGDSGNIGRFIPDHFDTTVVAPMTCAGMNFAAACPGNNLAYSGQPFVGTVTARNGLMATTLNYDGTLGFAKDVALSAVAASGGGAVGGGNLAGAGIAAANFAAGVANMPNQAFTFAATPTAPTDVFVRAIEAGGDGVSSLRAVAANSVEGGTKVVSGRIKFANAVGSNLAELSMTAYYQYWDGVRWQRNANNDAGTSLLLPGGVSLTGAAITSALAGATAFAGGFTFQLQSPKVQTGLNTSSGVVTVNVNPLNAPAWMQNVSGTGTASFGVFTGRANGTQDFIYLRESY